MMGLATAKCYYTARQQPSRRLCAPATMPLSKVPAFSCFTPASGCNRASCSCTQGCRKWGTFLSLASGSPFAQSRHCRLTRPCTQTLRPKHLVQSEARVDAVLPGQVHFKVDVAATLLQPPHCAAQRLCELLNQEPCC